MVVNGCRVNEVVQQETLLEGEEAFRCRYKISQETGIPYSTLKKRYNLANDNDDSYKTLLSWIDIPYSLLRTKQLGIAERFNHVNRTAGKDWLSGFLQRHPDLSIRKSEATIINRILGFSKTEILMMQYKFEPRMIYNVDKTGVTTIQQTENYSSQRAIGVGSVTSWERSRTVTVICAMIPSGYFIPHLFIFPRQRHSPHLEKDGPLELFTHVIIMGGPTKRYPFYG
ncbi:hypothetical protein NQ318_009660 [Aromia moschata]|uniref:Transposase n=1 Tax=Aromia moschata TaxID=1265417 RepID=A0AAV8Y0F0_9CUCU|nr:hypothetical protein NQ318_009660 [Aromia moschata]